MADRSYTDANTSLARKRTGYVRLYSVMPGRDGTGGTELADSWYAPQAYAYGTPVDGSMALSADVLWQPDAPGTAAGCAYWSAASGGEMYCRFVQALSWAAGQTLIIAAGSTVTE